MTQTFLSSLGPTRYGFPAERAADWNAFLDEAKDAVPFLRPGWLDALSRVCRLRLYLLETFREGRLAGILPLFEMRNISLRRVLVSIPYSTFGGILARDEDAARDLMAKAEALRKQRAAAYVELRQEKPLPAEENRVERTCFVTVRAPVVPCDELWRKVLSPRLRTKIRKAQRSGCRIEDAGADLTEFVPLFMRNMHRLGTPALPSTLFREVGYRMNEKVHCLLVRRDHHVVAGIVLVAEGDTIHEPWVASLQEHHRVNVNQFLYANAMEWAFERGFRFFDFGRSTLGSGTLRFKEQFGGVPIPLHYRYLTPNARRIPSIDAHHNPFETVVRAWAKLPRGFVDRVGPVISRYLPEW
ncbi:MAG: GNAT family N-acetyltransferase [Candidatus Hydrogenedentota bacterium]|nr:MAG: GNAT family N-acetyltransferase [Candidatus Hydrogenedentota bacterium]